MLLITCPFGLSALLSTEIKRLGLQPQDTFPTGCRVSSKSRKDILLLNLSLRIANKVYWQPISGKAATFEELFQIAKKVDRSTFISPKTPFTVQVNTTESLLQSERAIQSIVHKAIVTTLTGDEDALWTTTDQEPIEILVYIENNIAHLLVNTTGPGLHQRGRRQEQGEAPLKENLAAAVVLLASRPFHQPLRDPCCGSGTVVIEAARIARNIPSGSQRSFAFQRFKKYDHAQFDGLKKELMTKVVTKPRTIIGSDSDPDVLEKARRNAQRAGVGDLIQFFHHNLLSPRLPSPLSLQKPTTLVCNPPYEKRLHTDDGEALHRHLAKLVSLPGWNGAIISGYDQADRVFSRTNWKRKETRNGKERVYIRIPSSK